MFLFPLDYYVTLFIEYFLMSHHILIQIFLDLNPIHLIYFQFY